MFPFRLHRRPRVRCIFLLVLCSNSSRYLRRSSPRAPQPALAGVKVRKGAAAPYFRIFNYSVLSFILHTSSLFIFHVCWTCLHLLVIVQLRRKELLFMAFDLGAAFRTSQALRYGSKISPTKVSAKDASTLGHAGSLLNNGQAPSSLSAIRSDFAKNRALFNQGNYKDMFQASADTPADSPSGSPAPSFDWVDSNGSTWNTYDYMSNGSIGSSSAKSWDYLNADLARQYGMSRETAYQEALSNTGYQRSVADMQAAGLNPAAIFGAGSGYQASGVGYVSAATPSSGGSGYVAQTGVSRRGTSGKAQSDYNLTGKQYALIQLLGAGVGAMVTHSFSGALSGAAIGRYVAQYIGNK